MKCYYMPAALWIEGDALCRVATPGETPDTVRVQGTLRDPGNGISDALSPVPGSLWVEEEPANLCYVDESGGVRKFAMEYAITHGFIALGCSSAPSCGEGNCGGERR